MGERICKSNKEHAQQQWLCMVVSDWMYHIDLQASFLIFSPFCSFYKQVSPNSTPCSRSELL
jgi:hypothetical protein